MEPIFAIAFTLLFMAGLAIAVFFATVQPVWALIDVAIAQSRSNGEKVVWIVFLLLTWTLASVIYGLFFASRPLAVTTRVLFGILLLLVIVGTGIAIAFPVAKQALPQWF